MPSFDVVVVGSGIAGLVAAERLSARGADVTVLEQFDRPGGYFGAFENDHGDHFDLAVSHLLGGGPGGPLARLLAELELDESVTLEPVDIADIIMLGDRLITLPTGLARLEQNLGRQFPESRSDIAEFFGFMRMFMGADSSSSPEGGRFMMQHYRRYFEPFCVEAIKDPALRTTLAIRIQCDEPSLMIMAGFITECYGKGMVYPRGGVGALVDALVARLRRRGVKVVFRTRVKDIIFEDGHATGVAQSDGAVRSADLVLWGGDAASLNEILTRHGIGGLDLAERRRGHSSLSIFLTLGGADLSRFESAARYYVTDTPDVFETYRMIEAGEVPEHPVIKVHLMSRIDVTLAAPGRELIRIEVDMYHDGSRHDVAFYAEYAAFIQETVADRLVPEILTHCVYRRVVTPIDYERWFGHAGGSATGWAHNVENYMVRRVSQRTEAGNIFVTGQWGEHGSGLPQLIASADRSASLAYQWIRKRHEV
jgi:prolycopene isomerase